MRKLVPGGAIEMALQRQRHNSMGLLVADAEMRPSGLKVRLYGTFCLAGLPLVQFNFVAVGIMIPVDGVSCSLGTTLVQCRQEIAGKSPFGAGTLGRPHAM
jgi:hypothetical protein